MYKKLLYCFLGLSLLFACKKEELYYENIEIYELPIFFTPVNENKLIPKDEIKNKVLILNSENEVLENFSKSFLDEHPGYLDINFDKYTLLVRTSYVDYQIRNRTIELLKERYSNSYLLEICYEVGEICSEDNYNVERIAILTKKLNNESNIEAVIALSKGTIL